MPGSITPPYVFMLVCAVLLVFCLLAGIPTRFGADARIRWIEPDALQAGETVTEQAMKIIENDGEETA